MDDILYKLTKKMCECIIENDKCRDQDCDNCINEFAKKVVEYSTVE